MFEAILLGAVIVPGLRAGFAAAIFGSDVLKGWPAANMFAQITPGRQGKFSAEVRWRAGGHHGHISNLYVALALRREDPTDSWRGPRAKMSQMAIIDLDDPKQAALFRRNPIRGDLFRHKPDGVRVRVGFSSAAPMDKADLAYARKLANRVVALGEAIVHGKGRAARSLATRVAAIGCLDRSLQLTSFGRGHTVVSAGGHLWIRKGGNAEASTWIYGEGRWKPEFRVEMVVFDTVARAREFESASEEEIPRYARATDVGPEGKSYAQFDEWDFVGRAGKAVLTMRYTFPGGKPGGRKEAFERQATQTLALAD